MKRLTAALALAAALALVPAQAAPATVLDLTAGVFPDDQFTALNSSGDPFAVGGGTTTAGTHFAFSAHLTSKGRPSGYAVVKDPTFGEAQGHVCSYFPMGAKEAEFFIVVEKGSGTLGSLQNLFFIVRDNPDSFVLGEADGCTFAVSGFGATLARGNIVVKN
jgi:hypothetical protein